MGIRVIQRKERVSVVDQYRPLESVVWQASRPGRLEGRPRPGPRPVVPAPGEDTPTSVSPPRVPETPGEARRPWPRQLLWAVPAAVFVLIVIVAAVWWGASKSMSSVAMPTPAPDTSDVTRRLVTLEEAVRALRADLASWRREATFAHAPLQPTWHWHIEAPAADRTAVATLSLVYPSPVAGEPVVRVTNLRTGRFAYVVLHAQGSRYEGNLEVVWGVNPVRSSRLAVQPEDRLLLEWVNAPVPVVPHVVTVAAQGYGDDWFLRGGQVDRGSVGGQGSSRGLR